MRLALAIVLAGTAGSCTNKLETGYAPRKIGSNEAERRGFYAPPFSREAREAEQSQQFDSDARRPRPGY